MIWLDIVIEYYIYCEIMDIIKLVNTAIASHSYNPLHEVLMKTWQHWEFPGGIVVRIHGFHCPGLGSTVNQGTKILQVTWYGQK